MQKPNRVKVIGFDSWTGGAKKYARLIETFKKKGLELTLVHLGSWGDDVGRPAKEMIGNLRVRDISSYTHKSFADIIDVENPACVLFLSAHTFSHRAFNRYCRYRKVPTIHLFHGFISVQDVDNDAPYRIDIAAHLRFVGGRTLKAIQHVWPAYMATLWETGATVGEWFRFGKDIVSGATGNHFQVFADDARADKCCVFAPADIEYAVKKYGYPREDIVVVGNPDIMTFGLTDHMIGSHLLQPPQYIHDVMYIDTGLMYTAYVFKSEKEFVRHIIDTKKQLEQKGKHLVFKPHPEHFRRHSVLPQLLDADVDICSNEDFLSRLQNCCACICEPTTLSVIAALIGMPLFLARYGRLREQSYGKVLTAYPRAILLNDVRDFNPLLANEQANCDSERTLHWIRYNVGPLPAEEMPERVANVVLRLLNENNELRLD